LGLRDQIRKSLQKNEKQGKRGTWHSKSYHRFFEGYSEVSIPRPNGKGTIIQRIYTGNYYRQNITDRQRILIRILFIILYGCITFLFISSAITPSLVNSTWYVVLPEAVCLVFLSWILITFYSYFQLTRDLTIEGYRSSSGALLKASLGASISLGLTALATLVFIFVNLPNKPSLEIFIVLKYLAGGLISFSINRIERKVHYVIIPSQNQVPDNVNEIN
jgi:hypothetical protein